MAGRNDNEIRRLEREIKGVDNKDINLQNKLDTLNKELLSDGGDITKYTGKNVIELLTNLSVSNKFNANNTNMKQALKKKVGTNRNVINSMLVNKDMMGIFELERKRRERYDDYRTVELYIPEVSYCLNVIKDSILSPDSITKEFIKTEYQDINIQEIQDIEVQKNTLNMIKNFDLETKIDDITKETLKLGDQFYAVLEYKTEFEDILMNKKVNGGQVLHESNNNIIKESIDLNNPHLTALAESMLSDYRNNPINKKKHDEPNIVDVKEAIRGKVIDIVNNNFIFNDTSSVEFVKDTMQDMNDFNKTNARKSFDGNSGEVSFRPLKIDGAIVKRLDPDKVVKLFYDGQCYGYLYMKVEENLKKQDESVPYTDILNQINGSFFSSKYDVDDISEETNNKRKIITDLFSDALEKKLDRKFITKNKEFKDMIYSLCKSKELDKHNLKITYFAPDEIQHFRIGEREDGYGTSKLAKSLFFSMMYISTLTSELMTKIARGKDVRAVYVDVGIDEDIEGAIQSVVSDLKSKEITIDDLASVSSIMRTLSTFDDMFIPMVDGQEPVRFDTIPANSTEVDSEFLDKLLRSIIQGMGLPHNMIDSAAEVDFSRTLVMQNDNFVRTIVGLQRELGVQFSEFFNKIYNAEYGHKNKQEMKDLTVVFPTPSYLIMTAINDQLQNISQTVDFVVSTYMNENDTDTESDNIKREFKKSVIQDMVTNMDWDKYDKMFQNCKDRVNKNKLERDIKGVNTQDIEGADEFGAGSDDDGGYF